MAAADTRQQTKLNIIVQKGVTLDEDNAKFLAVDNDGDDINLSGYDSATLVVKKASYSSASIIEFDTADGSLTLGNGYFVLDKTPSEMDIEEGGYYFIMKAVLGSDTLPIVKGIFTVIA